MSELNIRQLKTQKHLHCEEQEKIYGGNIGETILGEYSNGKSNISISGDLINFTGNDGNASGTLINRDNSSFYIKDGIIERVDNGEVTDSINLNSAFLF